MKEDRLLSVVGGVVESVGTSKAGIFCDELLEHLMPGIQTIVEEKGIGFEQIQEVVVCSVCDLVASQIRVALHNRMQEML